MRVPTTGGTAAPVRCRGVVIPVWIKDGLLAGIVQQRIGVTPASHTRGLPTSFDSARLYNRHSCDHTARRLHGAGSAATPVAVQVSSNIHHYLAARTRKRFNDKCENANM
jgi:hypothetical protein